MIEAPNGFQQSTSMTTLDCLIRTNLFYETLALDHPVRQAVDALTAHNYVAAPSMLIDHHVCNTLLLKAANPIYEEMRTWLQANTHMSYPSFSDLIATPEQFSQLFMDRNIQSASPLLYFYDACLSHKQSNGTDNLC